MWNKFVSFLPEWTVIVNALITFLVPYSIAKLYSWIRS